MGSHNNEGSQAHKVCEIVKEHKNTSSQSLLCHKVCGVAKFAGSHTVSRIRAHKVCGVTKFAGSHNATDTQKNRSFDPKNSKNPNSNRYQ